MNLHNLTIEKYADDAKAQFSQTSGRLSEIESSFITRMGGKSMAGLFFSLVFTLVWVVLFMGGAYYFSDYLYKPLLIATLISLAILVFFMIIDNALNFSYYGKISGHKKSVSILKNRVNNARDSISSNQKAFLSSRSKGWNYALKPAPSIYEEATRIETTISGIRSLESGFVNGVKNVFYYISVVLFTALGSYALFPAAKAIMRAITELVETEIPEKTMNIICIVAGIIAIIVSIFIARAIWGGTNCSVTSVTLLSLLVGPPAFLLLILLAALVVALVMIVISIAVVLIGGAIAIGCLCGG